MMTHTQKTTVSVNAGVRDHAYGLITCLVAIFFVPLAAVRVAEAQPNTPNIVIFLVDDMGVMDTSLPFLTDSAGKPKRYPLNDFYRTPNLERLAAGGIRFSDFYAMNVCSPTRISLMTGQNAARHHTTNWINADKNNGGPLGPPHWNWEGLKKGDVTLARLLRAAGYQTIHIGKGHFGPRKSEGADPKNLGFEINVGGGANGEPASYYGMKNYGNGRRRSRSAVPHLEKYHGTETFLTDALTLEAESHVTDAVKAGKPFFLYLAHYAVHVPLDSDPRFAANYRHSGQSAPAQAFATLIEGADKSLGDLLDCLNSLGVAENTLILFLGDNGTDAPLGPRNSVACAAPLRGKKGTHYEGGIRVPFVAAWAKRDESNQFQRRLPIAAGAIQSQLATVCDLFPTLLALTGIQPPPGHVVDGSRLDVLLTDKPDATREEEFLMHFPHPRYRTEYFTCYRHGDWKVVYHHFPSEDSENSHYQLYDLATDPFESKNLATSRPDQLRLMMQRLIGSLEKHDALYPVDEEKEGRTLKPKLP